MEGWSFTEELNKQHEREVLGDHAKDYATWIQKNCLVSRNGFRLLPDLKEEISNEKAYELYLESLK